MAPVNNVVRSPQHVANVATEIGRRKGLVCRYEYDRAKGKFMYRFFRRGMFLGSVGNASRVISKMERYAA